MLLKLVSLNVNKYKKWEQRKGFLIKTLTKLDADVLMFQEVRKDPKINKKQNQLEEINSQLNYKYSIFSTVRLKIEENRSIQHGQGALLKFPLLKVNTYRNTPSMGDNSSRGYIDFDIEFNGKIVSLTNVHFSNHTEWSVDHLEELLYLHGESNRKAIIAGDFNILNIDTARELFNEKYCLSYDFKNYVSYPEKNETLDYCLIPDSYSFNRIELIEGLSDHALLYYEIIV